MCLFQFHSFGHWIHQIFLLNWVICDCLDSICALAFNSFQIWIYLWKIIAYFGLTRKGTCTFVVPRVLPIYATYCWNCPFVLWCVGLSGPLPEMVKGMRWFARFVGSRFVGYSGMRLFARFVGSRFVGYCLEPAMLCRPPLTSPRRGWMELPDVGDFCQVVIQKWMNHILTEIPLHPLYVWYDIQSFGELFLFVLWISMIWLQRQGRRLSFCTTYEFDMLWNASFTVDFAS